MKIIQILGGKVWGGRERHALDIAGTLSSDGYEVETVTKGEDAVDHPFREAGRTVSRMPLGGDFDFLTPVMLGRKMRRDPARCILMLTYTPKDTALAVKSRKLSGGEDKEIRIISIVEYPGEKSTGSSFGKVYESVDAFIFLSDVSRSRFMEMYPAIDNSRLHVAPPSVLPGNVATGAEPAPEEGSGSSSDSITLLCLGRIVEGKGVDTLIRALGKLSDLPLSLRIGGLGLGPYVSALKGEVWRAGVTERVEWLSQVTDVYEEIRRADIGIVPGGTMETFGLSMLEFMSQGVPTVVADNGIVRERVTHGEEAMIVTPDDPGALADAIRMLAGSRELRESMGEKAKATFREKYRYGIFLRSFRGIISSVFSKN